MCVAQNFAASEDPRLDVTFNFAMTDGAPRYADDCLVMNSFGDVWSGVLTGDEVPPIPPTSTSTPTATTTTTTHSPRVLQLSFEKEFPPRVKYGRVAEATIRLVGDIPTEVIVRLFGR